MNDAEIDQSTLLSSNIRSSEATTKLRESRAWLHSNAANRSESMNFEEMESIVWFKHQVRRFYQDRGNWWNSSRRTTALKWILVVTCGVLVACTGSLVLTLTAGLNSAKFDKVYYFLDQNDHPSAFFLLLGICTAYAFVAGMLCWAQPEAAGGGIAEVKAYLNGVNLNKSVRFGVCISKVFGMCFSCAAGLPLGKEGPMIHAGSIIGAAVSQGKSQLFGTDTSWTKFQDLRNDRTKRDFVTFGAAAGVAAAFRAPIGGIMFTLEEGASFWSTSLTFRGFFCALVTQITVSLILIGTTGAGSSSVTNLYQFGSFDNAPSYFIYELIIFLLMGAAGGVMGAAFNSINQKMTIFRMKNYDNNWKRMADLLVITIVWTCISFTFPLLWSKTQSCTLKPQDTANWGDQEFQLLDDLVAFGCKYDEYNPLASLFLVDSDIAMKQLFHMEEYDGRTQGVFSTGCLLLFFIPYFLLAAITSGTFAPAGLFIPTLLAGATFGRIIGHILNCAFPGYVTDAGSYALIGAAAVLGGMARMTIAGTVIVLEACGNTQYLMPLMLTFAAARYTGNAINEPMYDMQIRLKEMPFLADSLKTLGFLNYVPVSEIMSTPVKCINEINQVDNIFRLLSSTSHNGYPVVNKEGHLRGIVLRKTLAVLLQKKAFIHALSIEDAAKNTTEILFHNNLEQYYPHYPDIKDIKLDQHDNKSFLDVRPYMERAPYTIGDTSSIQRSYRLFRTMGLRHLVVVNADRQVCGILTRQDLTEHRLENHWFQEGDNMQKYMSLESGGNNENSKSVNGYIDRYDESFTPASDLTRISAASQSNAGSTYTNSFSLGADAPSFTSGLFGSVSASTATTKDRSKTKEPKSLKSNV